MAGWIEIEIISLVILINFSYQYKCVPLFYWIVLFIEIIVLLLYMDFTL